MSLKTPNFANSQFSDREQLREHLAHLNKLYNVKPSIDNKPPRSLSHMKFNSKKKLTTKLRQEEIDSHNRILLEKLRKIGSKAPEGMNTVFPQTATFKQQVRVRRLAQENYGILTRIRSAKPHYPVIQFNRAYEQHLYLREKLSENARRVPKKIDFNTPGSDTVRLLQGKNSRPCTATMRPYSAKVLL